MGTTSSKFNAKFLEKTSINTKKSENILKEIFIGDIAKIIYEYTIDYSYFTNFLTGLPVGDINTYFKRHNIINSEDKLPNHILTVLLSIKSQEILIELLKIMINEYKFDINAAFFYTSHHEFHCFVHHIVEIKADRKSKSGPLFFLLHKHNLLKEEIILYLIDVCGYNVNIIYKKWLNNKRFQLYTLTTFFTEYEHQLNENIKRLLRKRGALKITEILCI